MTQTQLDAAIARATGDDLTTIQRQGFSLLSLTPETTHQCDDYRQPLVIDWDLVDAERAVPFCPV
ncbi:hypothetical protein GC163_24205 [bacterium]|nr:hypothetical protein [bacterium]